MRITIDGDYQYTVDDLIMLLSEAREKIGGDSLALCYVTFAAGFNNVSIDVSDKELDYINNYTGGK